MPADHPEEISGERVGRGLTSEETKARYVRGMFDAIAPRYDLANTLLSAGLHLGWKRHAARLAAAPRGGCGLDVCCGTGDLTLLLARSVGSEGTVLGMDFSEPMLRIARRRAAASRRDRTCRFVAGDAEALPLPDASVDAITVGFGIRNVGRPAVALRELHRVLRPGGRLVVLEFSRPTGAAVRQLYAAYSLAVVPPVGRLIGGHRDAYRYLTASIGEWPDQRQFAEALRAVHFAEVRYHNLLGGIAAIHIAARRVAVAHDESA